MPRSSVYNRTEFLAEGVPVVWHTCPVAGGKGRQVVISRLGGGVIGNLSTEVGIQAVLYGLRYWARSELLLIDELFREDIGNVMFPIHEPGDVPAELIGKPLLIRYLQ